MAEIIQRITDFAGVFQKAIDTFAHNRRCQRRTVSTLLPTVAAISIAFSPAPAPRTILARQTSFCDVLRSLTRPSNRSRSASLTEIRSIFLIDADSQG